MTTTSVDTPQAPTTATTSAPNPSPPASPPAHRASFPHRTSSAAAVKPFIDTSTPAINRMPVELDGTPTSPEEQMARRGSAEALGATGAGKVLTKEGTFSPEEVMEELAGERGVREGLREKRAQLLDSRSRDPAVLVDIPQTPNADELAIAEGVSTTGEVAEAVEKLDIGKDETEGGVPLKSDTPP